jgi:hypothetical protein
LALTNFYTVTEILALKPNSPKNVKNLNKEVNKIFNMHLGNHGIDQKEELDKVLKLLDKYGVTDKADQKVKVDCFCYGKHTVSIPKGWRVVKGKDGNTPIKGDKTYWADTKEFRTETRFSLPVDIFFLLIRRIHRKKSA